MGSLLLLSFIDPDGGGHEVVWVKPGVPVAQGPQALRVDESPAGLARMQDVSPGPYDCQGIVS